MRSRGLTLASIVALASSACSGAEKDLAEISLPPNVTTCLNQSFAPTSSAAVACLILPGAQGEDGQPCALRTDLPICTMAEGCDPSASAWTCATPKLEIEEGEALDANLYVLPGGTKNCADFVERFAEVLDSTVCETTWSTEGTPGCLARIGLTYDYDGQTLTPSTRSVTLQHSGHAWLALGDFASNTPEGAVCSEISEPRFEVQGSGSRCPGQSCIAQELVLSMSGQGTGVIEALGAPRPRLCAKSGGAPQRCELQYPQGNLQLMPRGEGGASFAGWMDDRCEGAPCELLLDGPVELQPVFGYGLSLRVLGRGTVRSDLGPECSSTGPAVTCERIYSNAEVVSLTADDTGGWSFAGWEGADCLTESCAVEMVSPVMLTAIFGLPVDLTVVGEGRVRSTPQGIDCPGACSGAFAEDDQLSLSATPAGAGISFHSWLGACEGNAQPTCDLGPLREARSLTANFGYDVSIETMGPGSVDRNVAGTAGVACASNHPDCQSYLPGSMLTLTAQPQAGARLVGWSVASCGGLPQCTLTVDAAQTVTAQFEDAIELNVQWSGMGSGEVTAQPDTGAPQSCVSGVPCSLRFPAGTQLTLTATEQPGSHFSQWGGDCSGRSSCAITLDSSKQVTATFVPRRDIALTIVGGGQVMFSPSPLPGEATQCSGDCVVGFAQGTQVSLTQTPGSGGTFQGWSGACSGTGACMVTVDQDRAITASFFAEYDLTTDFAGQGTGSITLDPPNRVCNVTAGSCTETYAQGTQVTLTTGPPNNRAFVQWAAGPCQGQTNPVCTFTMDQAYTATAEFAPLRPLTVRFNMGAMAGTGTVEVVSTTLPPETCTSPTQCVNFYPLDTQLTLTAMPTGGSQFTGWTGGASGTCGINPVCMLTADSNLSIVANFSQ